MCSTWFVESAGGGWRGLASPCSAIVKTVSRQIGERDPQTLIWQQFGSSSSNDEGDGRRRTLRRTVTVPGRKFLSHRRPWRETSPGHTLFVFIWPSRCLSFSTLWLRILCRLTRVGLQCVRINRYQTNIHGKETAVLCQSRHGGKGKGLVFRVSFINELICAGFTVLVLSMEAVYTQLGLALWSPLITHLLDYLLDRYLEQQHLIH